MKKKTIYGALALSSLLLGSVATGFADDNVQSDNVTDAVVITPIDVPITTPNPSDSDLPITTLPTPGSDDFEETPPTTEPSVPITTPVDIPITTLPIPGSDDSEEKPITDVISQPSVPLQPTPANPAVPSDFTNPVLTQTGYEIVSTENSQVVIKTEAGGVATVAPEVVGAVVQSDGTVVVTDSKGELRILPETGDEHTTLMSGLGVFSIVFGILGHLISRRNFKA